MGKKRPTDTSFTVNSHGYNKDAEWFYTAVFGVALVGGMILIALVLCRLGL